MDALVQAYASSESSSSSDEEVGHPAVRSKRQRVDASSSIQWIRSFPHVKGNWPSHIYIEIDVSPALAQYMEQVIQVLQQRTVEPILPLDSGGRLHLSLSRPFVLEHADIEDFVQTLRHGFRWKEASVDELWLDGCGIFLNDDLTRSFVSLLVEPKKTREVVIDVISVVDQVLKRFHLPVYYENPQPHVSFGSALGHTLDQITQTSDVAVPLGQPLDQTQFQPPSSSSSLMQHVFPFSISRIHCQIGNKMFCIELK